MTAVPDGGGPEIRRNRATIWSLVGALALLVLGGAWFLANYDRVPATRRESPAAEALRNPHLALERFSARMGRPLARLRGLDKLTAGGVLLLDRDRRLVVDAQRADALFAWVQRGGYLIVAAEAGKVDDPVLERLGVARHEAAREDSSEPDEGETDRSEASLLMVPLPGVGHPLRMEWSASSGLAPGATVPLWRAGTAENHNALLHYAWGEGFVTVVDDFGFLNNWNIGEQDHAELFWTLLRQYRPDGDVRLAARLEVPSLWTWLAESAWMALASGAALILAWLWSIVPRFGVVCEEPEPARRGLREHLAALGRAVWREGGAGAWLDWVRRDFRARLSVRHPHLDGLPSAERLAALARLGHIAPEQAAQMEEEMEKNDGEAAEDLLRLLRTLQRIEQRW